MSKVSLIVRPNLPSLVLLNGKLITLNNQQLALLTYLLAQAPTRYVSVPEIVEFMWPDPDKEPDGTSKVISSVKYSLTKKLGKIIKTNTHYGYKIPARNRGYDRKADYIIIEPTPKQPTPRKRHVDYIDVYRRREKRHYKKVIYANN